MDSSDEKSCEGVTHVCDPNVKFGCKDSGKGLEGNWEGTTGSRRADGEQMGNKGRGISWGRVRWRHPEAKEKAYAGCRVVGWKKEPGFHRGP